MSRVRKGWKKVFNRIAPLFGIGVPKIVRSVHRDRLSYLGLRALSDLYSCVRSLEKQKLEGVLVEAGCALGGSAIAITAAKSPTRPLYVFDVFDMIPAPSARDGDDIQKRYEDIQNGRSQGIDGDKYYGYEKNLYEKVKENFRRHGLPVEQCGVHLVQGLFQETLHLSEPVALAHIDGDWYESVSTCLARLAPRLVVGGRMIIDDYEAWSGCRIAVDEYFAEKRDEFHFECKSRLHIVRVRPDNSAMRSAGSECQVARE